MYISFKNLILDLVADKGNNQTSVHEVSSLFIFPSCEIVL